ncbi:MAG TPA: hypothetical protein VNG69_06740 [Casimicrobiaceae bacterium]|nr:hypothetical protein [Casimicrobiaceae bacterium]
MTPDFAPLARELDQWRARECQATLWWRDDDATCDSPQLRYLVALAQGEDAPIALAAIPAAIKPSLAAAIDHCAQVTIVQHGYAHHNHAPVGERGWELGAHRPLVSMLAELSEGRRVLEEEFGDRFVPMLVPPWNRIDASVVASLPATGMVALSTFGPRAQRHAANGVAYCNTHVDPIAWKSGRTFIGGEKVVARIVDHLTARREGRLDADEATGLLTHHLNFDAPAFAFLAQLLAWTRTRGEVRWLDARELIVISSRSA